MKNKKKKGIVLFVCALVTSILLATTVFAQNYPEGIVAYWNLDEGSGSIANDSVGNNDGTIYGATWNDGKCNDGLDFDGINDYISVPNSSELNPSGAVTVEAWVKPNSLNKPQYILLKGTAEGVTWSYNIGISNDNKARFGVFLSTWQNYVYSQINLEVDKWYHLVGTFDGSTKAVSIYVNGVFEDSIVGDGSVIRSSSKPLTIGISFYSGMLSNPFDGIIDEVAIYNRTLTQEEIQQRYQNGMSCDVIPIAIDIKPGSDPNSINLSSAGVIPVAILSSNTFDATQVNPETIFLAGAGVKLAGKSGKYLSHEEDVNGDGLLDLVCQVYTAQFMIEIGESSAELNAKTFDGAPIRGEDSVKIVPDYE